MLDHQIAFFGTIWHTCPLGLSRGYTVPAGIQVRGPHQFRVQIRRNGLYQSRTFEKLADAREWQRVIEGKVTGDEFIDQKLAHATTLAQACEWMAKSNLLGNGANAKNFSSKLNYWKSSKFGSWSLVSIHDWDLIEWRREVLDQTHAPDDNSCGPAAECGAQNVIHRLNVLSKLIQTWARAHRVPIENPVKPGVRPSKPEGRNRRLADNEERRLLEAAEKSRPWLKAAIIIALETCLRQSELAGLTWDRVKLTGPYPHLDLLKTKNDRPRRVPLSKRAVVAFKSLRPKGDREKIQSRPVLPVDTGRGIIHAFHDAVGDGFADLRWHDLRHEGVSRLFELTDLRDNEIMAISGHITPAMLTRYTHLRADRLSTRLPGGKLNPRRIRNTGSRGRRRPSH
jgi:integrase